jgi:hypothetical protein
MVLPGDEVDRVFFELEEPRVPADLVGQHSKAGGEVGGSVV